MSDRIIHIEDGMVLTDGIPDGFFMPMNEKIKMYVYNDKLWISPKEQEKYRKEINNFMNTRIKGWTAMKQVGIFNNIKLSILADRKDINELLKIKRYFSMS